jgi:predicted CxxxxCH...CXXCH cytochrome family protein
VDFSQGSMARLQGRSPTFDPATKTCSNVYCHGDGVASGPTQAVVWSPPSAVGCASCHGSPPALLPGGQAHPSGTTCGSCHTGYTASAVNPGLHVNGSIEGTQGCGSCHGLPPASGEHGQHRRNACGECHPAGYTSSSAVAPFHENGTVDLRASAGWNAGARTCANACHGSERW